MVKYRILYISGYVQKTNRGGDIMKKKLIAFIAAAALAIALPMTALAANSPTNQSGTANGTAGATVSINGATYNGTNITLDMITVNKGSESSALKAALPSGDEFIGYFDVAITVNGTNVTELSSGSITVNFPVGTGYNGKTATIAHDHNGSISTSTSTVSGSSAAATASTFSNFAVSVNASGSSASSGSSTSPKTGTGDMTGLFVLTAVAILGAGVTFALKKSTQR